VLLTNHVLSGALIGALSRRPLPAFAVGVVSHFVVDAIPHWGKWGSRSQFLRVAVPDGLVSLATMGTFAAVAPPARRLFGWSPWPGPVDRFHGGIQRESPRRAYVELLAACAFGGAAAIAVRRPLRLRVQ